MCVDIDFLVPGFYVNLRVRLVIMTPKRYQIMYEVMVLLLCLDKHHSYIKQPYRKPPVSPVPDRCRKVPSNVSLAIEIPVPITPGTKASAPPTYGNIRHSCVLIFAQLYPYSPHHGTPRNCVVTSTLVSFNQLPNY